jgi:hypothetical protein
MGTETFTGPGALREFHFEATASLFQTRADSDTAPSACQG